MIQLQLMQPLYSLTRLDICKLVHDERILKRPEPQRCSLACAIAGGAVYLQEKADKSREGPLSRPESIWTPSEHVLVKDSLTMVIFAVE